jgi:putative heme utilization radical SAM enzyme HutW
MQPSLKAICQAMVAIDSLSSNDASSRDIRLFSLPSLAEKETIMDISQFDESILGRMTPDPLQFAFDGKVSAHAGRSGRPIPHEQQSPMFEGVLQSLPVAGRARCLYIHIPFCRVRCTFCSFFQYAASPTWIAGYLEALWLEMTHKAQQPWVQAAPFDAVYVGGGTPTDLSADQLALLGHKIQTLFPLSADCEITLEGRLNGFDDAKFDAALAGGFNRFSFGVQSFDTQVRRSAKRLDDRDAVLARLAQLTQRDAAPIIVDLLFGLPFQDEACWQRDIADFLASGAHGVDLYQLIEMQGTPMARLVEQGKQPAPAATPFKARQYAYGAQTLEQAGLQRLSTSHWARDSRERSRYNALAKTSADVLPLGAGAGGQINGIAVMQHRELEIYKASCMENQWPLAMLVTPAAHAERDALLKSAFDRGVIEQSRWVTAGQAELFATLRPLFAAWSDRGLMVLQDDRAELTLAGRFWSVNLAQAALTALARHFGESAQAGPFTHPRTLSSSHSQTHSHADTHPTPPHQKEQEYVTH